MSGRVSAEKAVDPEVLLESIRSLIENEDAAGAKRLAAEAAAMFPDYPPIQQMHHFFRPRKVAQSTARVPDRRRAFARLKEEAPNLRGRWVALDADDVVASAESLKELLAVIEPMALEYPPLSILLNSGTWKPSSEPTPFGTDSAR